MLELAVLNREFIGAERDSFTVLVEPGAPRRSNKEVGVFFLKCAVNDLAPKRHTFVCGMHQEKLTNMLIANLCAI